MSKGIGSSTETVHNAGRAAASATGRAGERASAGRNGKPRQLRRLRALPPAASMRQGAPRNASHAQQPEEGRAGSRGSGLRSRRPPPPL